MGVETIMYREFHVVFEPGENGWIIARAPEIPGALSQGRTLEEARTMITDAVRTLLAFRHDEARRSAAEGAHWETLALGDSG
ncbi:MAG: type II toxin-antitoxin system HicB family antitoxin [Armatimonadetes bacterium]|nr:type II toxin-antitoxin system HicB family antitoxin [Armatimonadota bacterium]